MKHCKYCSSEKMIKNGFPQGVQRYRCKSCGKNQIAGDKRIKHENALRAFSVAMYLNGSGFRSIGRVFGVSFQIVHHWIKQAGKAVENIVDSQPNNPKEIAILEMDELFTYIQKKRGKSAYGLLLIGTEMRLLRIT
jgi:transposase-like protein